MVPPPCAKSGKPGAPARVWLLTQNQYGRTVQTLFQGRSRAGNKDLMPFAGFLPLSYVNASDRFTTRATSYLVGDQEITFTKGERAGMLTQPSWLVAHSQPERNDAILRDGGHPAAGHDMAGVWGHGKGFDPPNDGYNPTMQKLYQFLSQMIADLLRELGPLASDTAVMMTAGQGMSNGTHHATTDRIAVITYDGTGTLRTGGRYLRYGPRVHSVLDMYCAFAHAAGAPTDKFGAGALNVVKGPPPEAMA
jgi:hypothetical protein